MSTSIKIKPSLWFGGNAHEAAQYYTSIFPNSSIDHIERYTSAGRDQHQMAVGSVMVVDFTLNGSPFSAINGPPLFKFSEAISFMIDCKDQEEVDYYWNEFGKSGEQGPCGWVKDKYGLSWQVTPTVIDELMKTGTEKQRTATMAAMMKMTKIDVEVLKKAHAEAA